MYLHIKSLWVERNHLWNMTKNLEMQDLIYKIRVIEVKDSILNKVKSYN